MARKVVDWPMCPLVVICMATARVRGTGGCGRVVRTAVASSFLRLRPINKDEVRH
jgi:hypothetical protein